MKSKKIVLSGLFCAIGVLLPQVFHVFGQSVGSTFLPMHIPVLLAGLLLGVVPGAVVGLVSPLLSTLFTGMPNPIKLPFMVFELVVYGVVAGLVMQKRHSLTRAYIALLSAQLAGRIVNAMCIFVATNLLHLSDLSVLSVWSATLMGLPGIVIQLSFIPPLYVTVQKVIQK